MAPNGARLTKSDHPALPVSIDEVVATAKNCHRAGADGLHAHIRDRSQRHVLDAGLYRELIAEMHANLPDMQVQITTEAVGRYTPDDQIALVKALQPRAVSVAFREVARLADTAQITDFYNWAAEAGIAVQHILYDSEDIAAWAVMARGLAARSDRDQVLLVLGRNQAAGLPVPDHVSPMVAALQATGRDCDWALCAFGPNETDCLKKAADLGGKIRVGFENNLRNRDGRIARDNAARVAEITAMIGR